MRRSVARSSIVDALIRDVRATSRGRTEAEDSSSWLLPEPELNAYFKHYGHIITQPRHELQKSIFAQMAKVQGARDEPSLQNISPRRQAQSIKFLAYKQLRSPEEAVSSGLVVLKRQRPTRLGIRPAVAQTLQTQDFARSLESQPKDDALSSGRNRFGELKSSAQEEAAPAAKPDSGASPGQPLREGWNASLGEQQVNDKLAEIQASLFDHEAVQLFFKTRPENLQLEEHWTSGPDYPHVYPRKAEYYIFTQALEILADCVFEFFQTHHGKYMALHQHESSECQTLLSWLECLHQEFADGNIPKHVLRGSFDDYEELSNQIRVLRNWIHREETERGDRSTWQELVERIVPAVKFAKILGDERRASLLEQLSDELKQGPALVQYLQKRHENLRKKEVNMAAFEKLLVVLLQDFRAKRIEFMYESYNARIKSKNAFGLRVRERALGIRNSNDDVLDFGTEGSRSQPKLVNSIEANTSLRGKGLKMGVESKEAKVKEPSVEEKALKMRVESKETKIEEPSLDEKASNMRVKSKKAKVEKPSLEEKALKMRVKSKEAKVEKPSLEEKALKMQVKSKEAKVEEPSLEEKTLKIRTGSKEVKASKTESTKPRPVREKATTMLRCVPTPPGVAQMSGAKEEWKYYVAVHHFEHEEGELPESSSEQEEVAKDEAELGRDAATKEEFNDEDLDFVQDTLDGGNFSTRRLN